MAQIPNGKKKKVARTAGYVQSRSGTVVAAGTCWNPPALFQINKKSIVQTTVLFFLGGTKVTLRYVNTRSS